MRYLSLFACVLMIVVLAILSIRSHSRSSFSILSRTSKNIAHPLTFHDHPLLQHQFRHSFHRSMTSEISPVPTPESTQTESKTCPGDSPPELSPADFHLYNRLAELMEYY